MCSLKKGAPCSLGLTSSNYPNKTVGACVGDKIVFAWSRGRRQICMKIKFRPLGLPFWGHRRADYMFTAGIGVGRQASFMGKGRGSLFEQYSGGKARMAASKASDAYRSQAPWPQDAPIWHPTGVVSTEKSLRGSKRTSTLRHRFSPIYHITLSSTQTAFLATFRFTR